MRGPSPSTEGGRVKAPSHRRTSPPSTLKHPLDGGHRPADFTGSRPPHSRDDHATLVDAAMTCGAVDATRELLNHRRSPRINVMGRSCIETTDGTVLEIKGTKPQVLLSYLALHANQSVDVDRLVDALWGEQSPASTSANLQTYASRIRRQLGRAIPAGATRLRHVSGSYRLDVGVQECDVVEFSHLCRESQTAFRHGRIAQARQSSEQAMQIPYGSIFPASAVERCPRLMGQARQIEELYVGAFEVRTCIALSQNRAREILVDLRSAVADFPLRERLHQLLILALCQAKEFGAALQAFQEACQALADQLGIGPGPALREVYETLLRLTAASGEIQMAGHHELQTILRRVTSAVEAVEVARRPNAGP